MVVDTDPQAITVQSVTNPVRILCQNQLRSAPRTSQDAPLEKVGYSSQRLWHGSSSPACWQPQRSSKGRYREVFGAKSRIWQVVMPGMTAAEVAAMAAQHKRGASGMGIIIQQQQHAVMPHVLFVGVRSV